MIAMALACEPKLLIADEPTTALDVTIQAQILDLLDRLREELHMAVVLITHDMGVIAGRTDQMLVMYAGKLIEGASTEDVFTRMRHPYSEALLASVPKLDQDSSVRLLSIPGKPPELSGPICDCRFSPRCRYVQPVCKQSEPPLVQAADSRPDHVVACYHQVGVDARTGTLASESLGDASDVSAKIDPGTLLRQEDRVQDLEHTGVLLELEHVVKEFPVSEGSLIRRRVGSVKAVSDVSFNVRNGETFGLVGESGCGKTTIGRMVVALEPVNSGSIRFDGQEITQMKGGSLRGYRRDLQIMFQDPYASLDPRMRVGTILREPLVVQSIGDSKERTRRVEELLDEVGMSKRAMDLYPHEFSGGQRQRIGLARALTLNPRLIVADEPVSALDVSIQAQILNLLKDLQARRGLAYIFISHDLAVVKYVSDTIGVMYLGKLVEVAPAAQLYENTVHPYARALIDIIPVADVSKGRKTRGRHIKGELPSAIDPPSGCRFRTRCSFAQEICAGEEPKLRGFGDRHLAACHFPLQTPTAGSPATRDSAAVS
jgi:oligopeptide/dipeptide ABC transporter ATP-binding protein